MRSYALIFGACILACAAPAVAQESTPQAQCAATDANLPAAFSAWTDKQPVTSAATADGLRKAKLELGHAVTAALHSTPEVRYAVQPEKPGGTVSYGGELSFAVAATGTYRILLGTPAWIDVVKDGAHIESVAHGRGPACSSIHKFVDFKLAPGRYVLQISANADAQTAVLAVPAP